jgi:hypothetical protein
MEKVKPMYRPHTILASTNSIELTLAGGRSLKLPPANRDPSRGTTLDSIHQLIPASHCAELQR